MTDEEFLARMDVLRARLLARTDTSGGDDACWEWQGSTVLGFGSDAKSQRGYGQLGGTVNGVRYHFLTHRLALSLHLGRLITPAECVLHRCDNPACNNWVRHLFLGDRKVNPDDKVAKGRHNYRTHRGTDHGNAKLTDDGVREMRALYAAKQETQTSLARRFGLSQASVWAILHRKTWGHVE